MRRSEKHDGVRAGMRIAMAGTGLGDEHTSARRVYEEVGFRPLRQSVQYIMEL